MVKTAAALIHGSWSRAQILRMLGAILGLLGPPRALTSAPGRDLSMDEAVRLVRQHSSTFMSECRGHFLYRGENVKAPQILIRQPDLLDPETYDDGGAAARFFGEAEAAMKGQDLAIRPSVGHLSTPNVQKASQWGPPCIVFPLQKELHYAWLANQEDWWPLKPSPPDPHQVREFLQRELRVDEGLATALEAEHEVLISCVLDYPDNNILYGFLAVPVTMEADVSMDRHEMNSAGARSTPHAGAAALNLFHDICSFVRGWVRLVSPLGSDHLGDWRDMLALLGECARERERYSAFPELELSSSRRSSFISR